MLGGVEVRVVVYVTLWWQLVKLAILACERWALEKLQSLLHSWQSIIVLLIHKGFLLERLLKLSRLGVESVDVLPLALKRAPFIKAE